MMHQRQMLGWALLSLVATTLVMPVYSQSQRGDYYESRLQRKFVNKPNHIKKQGYYGGPDVPGIEKVGQEFGWRGGDGMVVDLGRVGSG